MLRGQDLLFNETHHKLLMHGVHVAVCIGEVTMILDPLDNQVILFHINYLQFDILIFDTCGFLIWEVSLNVVDNFVSLWYVAFAVSEIDDEFVDVGFFDKLFVLFLSVLLKGFQSLILHWFENLSLLLRC